MIAHPTETRRGGKVKRGEFNFYRRKMARAASREDWFLLDVRPTNMSANRIHLNVKLKIEVIPEDT